MLLAAPDVPPAQLVVRPSGRGPQAGDPKYGPVTRDSCEVCGRALRTSERVELVEVVPAYVDPDAGVGGGGISATYCPQHAP